MSEIETLVSKTGLLAWHAADAIEGVANGANVELVPDKSDFGRDLDCSSSHPTLATNSINGLPAVNFSGSQNPLIYSSSLTPKHIFIIAAYADAAFPAGGGANEYAGLLSPQTGSWPILGAEPLSTKFADYNFESAGTYTYKRKDIQYAENNLSAPMSGAFSIMEVSLSSGWAMDGIVLGRDRGFSTHKWKGKWVESLFYSRVLTSEEVLDIYEYFAMKYHLWRSVSPSGLDVWPFQPEWVRPMAVGKTVLSSSAVSGARKSRAKSTAKRAFEPQFESRWPEEYEAAKAFWNEKYPGTSFIYRDGAVSPSVDITMEFLSDLPQQAADYRDITYGFQAVEV